MRVQLFIKKLGGLTKPIGRLPSLADVIVVTVVVAVLTLGSGCTIEPQYTTVTIETTATSVVTVVSTATKTKYIYLDDSEAALQAELEMLQQAVHNMRAAAQDQTIHGNTVGVQTWSDLHLVYCADYVIPDVMYTLDFYVQALGYPLEPGRPLLQAYDIAPDGTVSIHEPG